MGLKDYVSIQTNTAIDNTHVFFQRPKRSPILIFWIYQKNTDSLNYCYHLHLGFLIQGPQFVRPQCTLSLKDFLSLWKLNLSRNKCTIRHLWFKPRKDKCVELSALCAWIESLIVSNTKLERTWYLKKKWIIQNLSYCQQRRHNFIHIDGYEFDEWRIHATGYTDKKN